MDFGKTGPSSVVKRSLAHFVEHCSGHRGDPDQLGWFGDRRCFFLSFNVSYYDVGLYFFFHHSEAYSAGWRILNGEQPPNILAGSAAS
jgi:hypothetical protein